LFFYFDEGEEGRWGSGGEKHDQPGKHGDVANASDVLALPHEAA
jgi:hypothetical protein